MGFLDFIFGAKKREVQSFINHNAIILDVRTQREWDNGHIEEAVHIPLDELNTRVHEIKSLKKPVITCCASGVRSAKAAKFLNLNNINATNGGGWISLQNKL
ncbi:rhodanese-like domain-containing protein [Bizionia paragorgiae]|uniref:rhodanese-like domain-containing protein n=1 Tax=Bizionia paragorgiae TaxID=283786 RepID=UPI00299E01DB|nr:rhodanese-like domain-containing protein [Bizionia paragorgiae]MDX1271388.1 rhodanese-like domain-containing protein [Bizionia paragorgiae]